MTSEETTTVTVKPTVAGTVNRLSWPKGVAVEKCATSVARYRATLPLVVPKKVSTPTEAHGSLTLVTHTARTFNLKNHWNKNKVTTATTTTVVPVPVPIIRPLQPVVPAVAGVSEEDNEVELEDNEVELPSRVFNKQKQRKNSASTDKARELGNV